MAIEAILGYRLGLCLNRTKKDRKGGGKQGKKYFKPGMVEYGILGKQK